MDENAPKENSPAEFNKIDLTQLQGFSFGTQWTQDKQSAHEARDRAGMPPRREERRSGAGEGGPDRRDRRGFRRPDTAGAPGGRAADPGGPQERRDGAGYRPRGDGPSARSGPYGTPGPERQMPYESREFAVSFYPEDVSFNALVKTIRASCRTIELFEIARTVLGKPDRFTVLVARREAPQAAGKAGEAAGPEAAPAEGAGAPAAAQAAPKPEVPGRPPILVSVPDGLPFETEEAAITHVMGRHMALFFDIAEVEVEPPKGNFLVVNRCGITGELLGPPNYHRYSQIVQQHHASKGIRMPLEAYRSRIETVRGPEAVNQWLEKMKRITRYTWKLPVEGGAAAPAFDSLEEARNHLLANARDKVARSAAHARFHGRGMEALPPGEIRRAVEGALERQRRFPLDTANALRGRLRREHFTIFKKGAKGISYVCAVKRKFRVPGQAFAENIGALIAFIEAHPMMKAGQLVPQFLGLGGTAAEAGPGAEKGDPAAALAAMLTIEQRERIARVQGDLLWLVREGYVTEFIDGSLYAPPAVAEARKKEAETAELDPENFPEAAEQPETEAGRSPEAPAQPAAEPDQPKEASVPSGAESPQVLEDLPPAEAPVLLAQPAPEAPAAPAPEEASQA